MRIRLVLIILLLVNLKGWTQQRDSVATTPLPDSLSITDSTLVSDSAEVKKGIFAFFTKDYPSPKKAAYLSLAIPGGGQIYNKRWWKLPLVYGAMGAMVVTINRNQGFYQDFKEAYQLSLDGKPHKFSSIGLSTNSLRLLRDRYDKNTQLSYIGLVVVYALQSVEAFVDAHLKTFDVNEDLSLRLKPSFQTDLLAGQPTLGIGVAIQFD